jgi:hypothetical protein
MSKTQSIARIDGAHFPAFEGRVVRIVGKVIAKTDATATIQTPDQTNVNVNLANNGQNSFGDKFTSSTVEIIGMLQPQNTVTPYTVTSFGDDFGT